MPHVRLRDIAYLVAIPFADSTARHSERFEYFTPDEFFIRLPRRCRCDFAGDYVHRVVIAIARTKTIDGLEMSKASNDIVPRE